MIVYFRTTTLRLAGTKLGQKSDSSQQHARTRGIKRFFDLGLSQVRTKSGEVIGLLSWTAHSSMPAPRESNYPLSVNWAIRFGLSQGGLRTAHSSMSAHWESISLLRVNCTSRFGLSQESLRTAHSSMPAQGESNYLSRVNWTISGSD